MGFFDDIGSTIGGAIGTNQYQTDPSKFQLGGPGSGWNGFAGAQGSSMFGIPMGPSWQDLYAGAAKQALNQQAPTLDASQQNQVNAQQSQLGQMLMAQANGGGPNPAAEQLKQGTNRNIAQAYALAQANPNNPAAARNIANNVAGINQQAAGDAAQQRMQQQLAAQSQLGGLLQGQRAQDIGWAQNAAQLAQNQFGMNNQIAQGYLQGGQNAANAQLQANIEQQKIQSGAYQNAANNAQKTTGGLLSGVGSALSLGLFSHGGEVPGYAQGGGVMSFLGGGGVPGRAAVSGDSPANDSVRAMVSPGEIVLPRSVTQSPDAEEKAAQFVAAIKARKKKSA